VTRVPRPGGRLQFADIGGESKARLFEVFGYAFLALKPE